MAAAIPPSYRCLTMRHGRASAVGLALMAVLGAFGMPSERTQVVQMLGLRPYNLTADLVDKVLQK